MPLCVIWGRDDAVLPVRQSNTIAVLAPHARVEVFPNAGHFPHKDHPDRFVRVVNHFMRSTQPSVYDRDLIRALLERGGRIDVRFAEAGKAPVSPIEAANGA
jgi:hypothetical protein